jgi:hypothetical protein
MVDKMQAALEIRNLSAVILLSVGFLVPAPLAAQIEATPRAMDLGERGHNEKVEAELLLKNAGKEPVSLGRIAPTCSCIQVDPPALPQPIAPGASVKLTVTMSSGRAMGALHKALEITRAGATVPSLRIPVAMSVLSDYEVEPRELQFEGVVGGQPLVQTVRVTWNPKVKGKGELSVSAPVVKGPRGEERGVAEHFSAKVVDLPGGKGIELTLLPTHPEGRIFANLHARLGGKELVVPLAGDMFRCIKVSPNYVNFNRVSRLERATLSQEVRLISTDGKPFKVVALRAVFHARSSPAGVQVQLADEPAADGKSVTVRATLAPAEGAEELPVAGSFSGKVTINTDHPEKPEIELPFFGFFSEKKP